MAQGARKVATLDDFLAIPEADRFHELLGGQIVERAAPSIGHGRSQARLTARLVGPFERGAGRGGPGGWWLVTEVDVQLAADLVVRPDLLGFRRDRHPECPHGYPVTEVPDWICEIVSPDRARDDTVRKMRAYQRARVGHYWIVDCRDDTLTVHRLTDDGYLVALRAERGERVRAEPFDAIEIAVGELFGDDPDFATSQPISARLHPAEPPPRSLP